MKRIDRILCPVDFSESSAIAFAAAQSLARHFQAKLTLLHVVEFHLPFYATLASPVCVADLHRRIRADALSTLHGFAMLHTDNNVPADSVVSEGVVADAILSFAAANNVGAIVMGAHGRKTHDRFALGSAAEKVLRKTRCPVLVCRTTGREAAEPDIARPMRLQKMLFCTDFSGPAQRALAHALAVAAEYGAELTILHVVEEGWDRINAGNRVARAKKQLEQLLPLLPVNAVKIQTCVRVGKAWEQIVKYATESQANLIVMAVRGRNAVNLAIFGSTTYRVIQLGPCSVLAVHADATGEDDARVRATGETAWEGEAKS
jgi:universal stress protein A